MLSRLCMLELQREVFLPRSQVLKDYQGTISLKELSEMTAIKVEDVVSTLQHLNLIQYQKGQHVICAAPKLIERSVNASTFSLVLIGTPSF